MLGMVEHGDGPCYVHMTDADGPWWRQRWCARDEWSDRADDPSVVDTVHVQLQTPSDGSNRLHKEDVVAACGPQVRALFLHCASGLSPADVLALVHACPNLRVLSLSECNVDDGLLRGIAASPCAANLAAIRLWMNQGAVSPAAVGALVDAARARLAWLDMQCGFFGQERGALDHAAWLSCAGKCASLRIAMLPAGVPPAALAALATCSRLELLSVDGDGPPTALSAIEPLVGAGLASVDLHGFALDAAASHAACASANRLVVGRDGEALPRAQLQRCARLAELRLRCELTEEDVSRCLAKLPGLRALHVHNPEGGVEPEVIGALGELGGLRCLNLSSCLGNYYEHGEEIADQNTDALILMAQGLEHLVQLDLSAHYDAFYACVEGEHCPYDALTQMACGLPSLRVLNLSDNGRKFAWGRLRGEMRCLNEDLEDGALGVTVHCGDGVTMRAGGDDGGGDDDDSDGGGRMLGEYYDSDECSDGDEPY